MQLFVSWVARLSICVAFKAAYLEMRELTYEISNVPINKTVREQIPTIVLRDGNTMFKIPRQLPAEPIYVIGDLFGHIWQRVYHDLPTFTHLLVVRDPLERLLSAYLDRCVATKTVQDRSVCANFPFLSYTPTFKQFVSAMHHEMNHSQQRYMIHEVDSHWRWQITGCGTRHATLTVIPWRTVENDSTTSLHAASLRICKIANRPSRNCNSIPFESKADHRTGSAARIAEYYQLPVLREAMNLYAGEYEALKLPIPSWATNMLDHR